VSADALPPLVQAFAPEFSGRFGRIIAAVIKLVAAGFLRKPRLALLIVPLCARLNRLRHRFDRLMAHLAAGRLPKPRAPASAPPGPGGGHPTPALPSGRLWLVRQLGSEAACNGTQLAALLAEPAVADLLAACPAAGRLLRPICRMLGVDASALPPAPPRAPRQRPAPPEPELPAADPPPCAPPAEALPRTLPPEPQPPLNAPAWLRERRPSIVVPFLPIGRRAEKPA